MSADLIIPDEAKSAGWEALLDARSENRELVQAYAQALHAAAPLIVAAELERMADTPFDDGPWWALASSLRDRAAELRGEQS